MKIPERLDKYDLNHKDIGYVKEHIVLTITEENLTKLWQKQNEIIAYLEERREKEEG